MFSTLRYSLPHRWIYICWQSGCDFQLPTQTPALNITPFSAAPLPQSFEKEIFFTVVMLALVGKGKGFCPSSCSVQFFS